MILIIYLKVWKYYQQTVSFVSKVKKHLCYIIIYWKIIKDALCKAIVEEDDINSPCGSHDYVLPHRAALSPFSLLCFSHVKLIFGFP